MTRRQRGTLAATVGAMLGLALAILISRRLPFRAAAGQLPGYAAVLGFDPRMATLRLALFAVLPLFGGAIAWWIAGPRPRRRATTRSGQVYSEGTQRRPARWRPGILAPAVVAHALSAWIFLVVPLGLRGINPLTLIGALLAVTLALATALGRGNPGDGSVYLGAACATLPFAFIGSRVPPGWLMVGLAAYALPPLARLCAVPWPGATRVARALTLAVLLPGSVTALAAAACMRAPRVADVFEDGHALLPASEYFRGELPYRDIVPGHGLVSDGLLAAGQLRLFGDDYAGLKRGEKVTGAFFWPSFYALGWAATGSPALGFGGLLLSFLFSPQYHNPRLTASFWALAIALYASRTKRPRAWLACGIVLPLCLCTAVEFAVYAAGGVAVALWVARGRRSEHLRSLCLGVFGSALTIGVVLAAFGILRDFLNTTFVFVPALLPVYALGFSHVALPGDGVSLLAALRDETVLFYAFVTISVVLLGAWLPRAPRVGPRARSVLPICAWAVLAMLSVLERQHTGYGVLIVPVGALLMARWLRGWRGWTSPRSLLPAAALGLLAWLRRPVFLLASIASAIANPWPPPGTASLSQPARARGGVFGPADAALVAATAEMMRLAGFGRDDTWFDFASVPGLYYLFDRNCPIRYYEVGFYETEDAQREVIAAVERNPHVRAVLRSNPRGTIDGVPNAVRAPRVEEFIRERFRPFYREGEVEFWLRKEGEATSGRR
jgi:hypothetical protein